MQPMSRDVLEAVEPEAETTQGVEDDYYIRVVLIDRIRARSKGEATDKFCEEYLAKEPEASETGFASCEVTVSTTPMYG